MQKNIEPSWRRKLEAEFEKSYFKELEKFIETEYQENLCFPPYEAIFNAFEKTPFPGVKVVILGQDPYHGIHQANGLSFSVGSQVKIPASLRNIFKELETDVGKPIPETGDLTNWARQGVLLLNTVLTVRNGQARSHKNKGWEKFTDAVIATLSSEQKNLVFMLWGEAAKKKGKTIDNTRHLVLESGHPSPLSAIRGHWFGNKHFSTANSYLIKKGKTPIIW